VAPDTGTANEFNNNKLPTGSDDDVNRFTMSTSFTTDALLSESKGSTLVTVSSTFKDASYRWNHWQVSVRSPPRLERICMTIM